MRDMLIEKAGVIWDSWDKKTMITFWNSHCIEPWDNWTMASCIDVPLCTPSQNTQESWHNNILIGKIPQMFGGARLPESSEGVQRPPAEIYRLLVYNTRQ